MRRAGTRDAQTDIKRGSFPVTVTIVSSIPDDAIVVITPEEAIVVITPGEGLNHWYYEVLTHLVLLHLHLHCYCYTPDSVIKYKYLISED